MFAKYILKLGHYNTENENRYKITMLSSISGLASNIVLSIVKFILFIVTGSISILSDSINNLTDCLSSIITVAGAKLSQMPSDKEHPYGHGRVEYISGLIVSAMVMVAGIEFVKLSYDRIVNPKPVNYTKAAIVLMIISILVKFYMAFFYKTIATSIDSCPIMAQSKDSIGDVFVTSVVVISIFVHKITNFHIDGYVGIIVSLFIIHSALELIKDTVSEILGKVPPELIKSVQDTVLSYDEIHGVHDVVVSTFGPEKTFIFLDAEINYNMSLIEAHELIDKIEDQVDKDFNCKLSIHADPVGLYTKEEKKVVNRLKKLMKSDKALLSFHDLSHSEDLLKIHVVVDGHIIKTKKDEEKIASKIKEALKKTYATEYYIEIDKYYF